MILVTFLLLSLQPRLLILEERALPGKAGGRAGSVRSGCSPPRCCSASRPIFKADGCSRGDRRPLPPPPCTETLQANFSSPQSRAFSPPWILSPPRRPPLYAHVAAVCQPLGSAPSPPAPRLLDRRETSAQGAAAGVQESPCRARRALTSSPGTSSSVAAPELKPSQ